MLQRCIPPVAQTGEECFANCTVGLDAYTTVCHAVAAANAAVAHNNNSGSKATGASIGGARVYQMQTRLRWASNFAILETNRPFCAPTVLIVHHQPAHEELRRDDDDGGKEAGPPPTGVCSSAAELEVLLQGPMAQRFCSSVSVSVSVSGGTTPASSSSEDLLLLDQCNIWLG